MNAATIVAMRGAPRRVKIGTGLASSVLRDALLVRVLMLSFFAVFAVQAQDVQSSSSPAVSLQSYFDTAQALQQNGDYAQASLQFQLFIANAMDRLAVTRSNIGDYARSSALFDQALQAAPNNQTIRLDYAEAALAAKDFPRARTLAQKADRKSVV